MSMSDPQLGSGTAPFPLRALETNGFVAHLARAAGTSDKESSRDSKRRKHNQYEDADKDYRNVDCYNNRPKGKGLQATPW